MADGYSFCEPTQAGPCALWCIRPLTKVGLKPGGGVDTASLCGRVKKSYGWDVEVPLTKGHIEHSACPKCVKIWKERGGRPSD